MSFLSKIFKPLTKAAVVPEGAQSPGPWSLPITGGWLPADVGNSWNWWQRGYNVLPFPTGAVVEACVSAYSQTVSLCPGYHWLLNQETGGRERVTTSSLSRVLAKPNAYQSMSDFLLNAVRSLYMDGNAYALAVRNNRFEIIELHLMNPLMSIPMVSTEGEVFYSLGGNQIVDQMLNDYDGLIPARDVLHIRLHTIYRHILLGDTPLTAVARDIATSDAILAQQLAFYLNQARPGSVLATDMVLDKDQVAALRQRWEEQTRGMGAGGTPILTAGLKPVALPTISGKDAEIAEILKMSEQHIALAFRVPLQILGLGANATGPTEALMRMWLASGLGFCLNHVEEAFGRVFGLAGYPDEYVEFDTEALLRSEFKDEIDALSKAVTGAILSPDEARAKIGYKKTPLGSEPRAQQQLVPLSFAGEMPAPAPRPGAPPSAPPAAAKPPQAPRGIDVERARRAARRRFHLAHLREREWTDRGTGG
jgi:HK97 family phage portal protein